MTVTKSGDSSFRVPTIDIAAFRTDPTSTEALKTVAQVREACMTTGFFELVGHGIPRSLQDRLFRAADALFALPIEEKRNMDRTTTGGPHNRGYELMGTQVLQKDAGADQKEGFYVSQNFPSDHSMARLHPAFNGPNIWPPSSVIPESVFKEPVEEYYEKMMDLSSLLLKVLAAGLPYGPNVFDEFNSNDPLASLRLLHYPPTESDSLGAGAHTDFGAFTFLLQDDNKGLQVQNPETKEWIPIMPNRDAYVVNIGDMMQRWTKGLYKSNLHRVINSGKTERYSSPFFFDGNLDCKLAPFDGTAPEGRALTVEEHMMERFASTYI